MSDIRNSLAERKFGQFYSAKQKSFTGLSLDDEEEIYNQNFIDSKQSRSITTSLTQYEVSERNNELGEYIVSIKHKSSGEVMHSSLDPIKESRRLYVEQAKLFERASQFKSQSKDLVIWDVGLGAATNASGAVECYQQTSAPINIESFEITLEPLSLVLSKKAKFPHAQHPWVEQIFSKHSVTEENFRWNLYLGDFMQLMHKANKPDLIFYDPFSYKVDSPLWTYDCFKKVYDLIFDKPVVAFTFSAATRVRAALLAAGFYVAKGFSTGRKQETTVFMTPKAATTEDYPLLDKSWLQKWHRSHSRYPSDVESTDTQIFDNKITSHPQFI
jgi:queuine tRNA-ribosyltransferase